MRTEVRSFEASEIEALIAAEGNFRKMRPGHADSLLADMLADRWLQPSTSPIVLSKDGERVIDGQHRLLAALNFAKQTRRKIKFLVVYSQNDEQEALVKDTNLRRTMNDYLRRMNAPYRTVLQTMLAVEANVAEDGSLGSYLWDRGAGGASIAAMAEIYGRCPRMNDVAAAAFRAYDTGNLGAPGLLGAVVWQIQKKNRTASERFLEVLGSGVGLSQENPIYHLRQYLQRRFARDGSARTVERRSITAAVIIKAWNAWITGEEVRHLRYHTGGRGEEFPQIEKGGAWSPFEKQAAAV
jgi:hypothetical protein